MNQILSTRSTIVQLSIFAGLVFILFSCDIPDSSKKILSNKEPEPLFQKPVSLKEKLSINPELQKALDYYGKPADTLKRKALLFLINNMDYKKGINLQLAKEFTKTFGFIYTLGQTDSFNVKKQYFPENYFKDRIQKTNPIFIPDLNAIHSDHLIENIEFAFLAWSLPWAKKVSFDNFCRYILPYRIHDEPLSRWRRYLFAKHKDLIDSLVDRNVTDPVVVCRLLNDKLFNRFVFYSKLNSPFIPVEDQYKYPAGDCKHRYFLMTAIARTFGLPMTIDFTPQYARFPGSHDWTVLIDDGNGNILPFNGGDEWVTYPFTGLKIYRTTYENNFGEYTGDLPSLFTNPTFFDVTHEYPFDVKDLEMSFNDTIVGKNICLFTFGIGSKLVPLAQGKIQNKKVIFKNVSFREDALVLVGYIKDGETKIIENPVTMYRNGYQGIYTPSQKLVRQIKLTRKYPVTYETSAFAENVENARIHGSNKNDFSDAVTLYTFKDAPQFFTRIDISDSIAYNYFRYIPENGKPINLAELHFQFHGARAEINGEYFASSSIENNKLKNIYDKNIRTNLDLEPDSWIGIKAPQNEKRFLSQVSILPRNNWNVIELNHTYELFYFDKEWTSIEKKIAEDFELVFNNVPANAVMLLKDLTDGKQERIFTYENYYQLFW